ncbi:uncharacterized protein VNE69_06162 [Vairimorpha necatrix]|uniref:Uncharacterized protein n=1 Tax=Vairimorpha necatrix TaxID=6039 RepID=A0AAX4JCX8_9MICR
MMFFLSLKLFLHIYQSISSSETETRLRHSSMNVHTQTETTEKKVIKNSSKSKERNNLKNEIRDCCHLLHQTAHTFLMTEFVEYEAEKISRILFNLVLDNINFPIKNVQDFIPVYLQYNIGREDINFNLYYAILRNENLHKIYYGKRKGEIFEFTKSFAEKTRNIYATLLCINFNTKSLTSNDLKLYIDKHLTVEMEKKKNYIFQNVFVNADYLFIAKKIRRNITSRKNENNINRLNQHKQNVYNNGNVLQTIDYGKVNSQTIE